MSATTTADPARVLADIATVTGRNLRRLVRVPTLIVFATVQPVMFVLLFTYAFGGAVHPPGVEHYVDYLLPGVFVVAIAFGASQTGVAVADDLATGMIDRFRALPMARSAVLAGRTAADAVRNLFVLAVVPLIFTSSTFVPVATMPGWLQAFAKVNPITVAVDALRALCLGGPTAERVWQALAWVGGLLAVTVPAAVIRYRRTTAI